MPAGKYNFICEQGADFDRTLTLKNANGTVINLTGYTARMQVRKDVDSAIILADLNTSNSKILISTPSNGQIRLKLDATTTAAIDKSGVYDLEIVSSGGLVDRILEGQFILRKNVTRS